ARAAFRRDAGSALSLPAPRLDGAAAARRAPHRHPRAGGADARAGGRRPRLFVARGLPRRLPRAHRGGAGGVHRGLRVSRRPALYVVDGHSNIFRAYHAMEYLSTSRGQPTHAILILSTMLWKLIREEQPEYLAIALDPPGPTFRDKLFAEYKATRTSMPSDLARQLPYIRRLFDALRTPVLEVPGYEADDVLATLVEHALKLTDLDVVLVTGDKDLLQLVGPRVRVLSVVGRTGEKIVYDEAKVRERWGVGPDQIPDVMALMGDSIDNVPGVKGVGEKTAVKLIGQYGSVARLYDNLTLIPGKLRETLAVGRKHALLSRELVVLNREVPIVFDLDAYRRGEPAWPPLLAAWLDARTPLPVVDDSAVAAYLLNPARATYKLDEVCMEAFGECPPALLNVAPNDLPRVLGDRARWLARFWEHARNDLQERG